MKLSLVVLILLATSFAHAVTLSHFMIERIGGGQFSAVISETSQGIRLNLKSCRYQPMPPGTEVSIQGQRAIAETKLILRGKASILSDMSPTEQVGESGSWRQLTYWIEGQSKSFEVKSPVILVGGSISAVLENLENEARELCK